MQRSFPAADVAPRPEAKLGCNFPTFHNHVRNISTTSHTSTTHLELPPQLPLPSLPHRLPPAYYLTTILSSPLRLPEKPHLYRPGWSILHKPTDHNPSMVRPNRMKCRNGAEGNEATEPKAIQQRNPKIFALSLDPPNPPTLRKSRLPRKHSFRRQTSTDHRSHAKTCCQRVKEG